MEEETQVADERRWSTKLSEVDAKKRFSLPGRHKKSFNIFELSGSILQ